MIRRPPRSTLDRSSAASDVYKRQVEYLRVEAQRELRRVRGLGKDIHHLAGRVVLGIGDVKATTVVSLEAVYYTHLRAHETVLDLVCRLLLEKKKQ